MALALVDNHPRPALRLLQGGADAGPSPSVYRCRRVVALILADALLERFGGDRIADLRGHYDSWTVEAHARFAPQSGDASG